MRVFTGAIVGFFALAAGSVAEVLAAPAIHHDLEVYLDPETGSLTVNDTITLSNRNQLELRFADWLEIEDVRAKNVQVGDVEDSDVHDGDQTTWIVNGKAGVTVPLRGNGPHKVEIRLSGTVPSEKDPDTGTGARADAGTGPQGSYLFGSSGWLPQTGDGIMSYQLKVSVPSPYQAVSSGRLIDESVSDDTYSATFTAALALGPPSLFAGPYQIRESRTDDDIRLRTYFHPELADFAETYLDTAERYLERFAGEIGPYPFEDFYIISAPLPVGLGFANLTYIDRRIVPLPFMQGRSLAHEVLHNWWGNGVQVAYREGNWAEGLTTYMADYGLAAAQGPEAARQMRLSWLRDYAALPAEQDTPVTRFITKRHQASRIIGYNKVAQIFHMLESEIGTAAFDAALKDFWSRHRFAVAGWSDLRAAFEAASGEDLGWFFAQWLDRTGAPTLQLVDAGTVQDDGGYVTTVSLKQSEPPYRLRVPVEIETGSGTVREHVRLSGSETTVRIVTREQPVRLRVDPSFDLFRHLLPGESPPILRDIMLAPEVSIMVLSENKTFIDAAERLSQRLVGAHAKATGVAGQDPADGASIVFGTPDRLERFAQEQELRATPKEPEGTTAALWVSRSVAGGPVLLVSADSAEELSALIRALPHYGRQSYVLFSGGKALERGVWPTASGTLTKSLLE